MTNRHIAAMAPYALADFSVPDGVAMVSLAQNESLRPPSSAALEAGRNALASSADYPDPDYPELRESIANTYGIDERSILYGAGSMELITCIAQTVASPYARVLTTEYGYALFRNSAQKVAAPCDLAPEKNHTVSTEDLLNAVRSDTRLCFIANPGNPTGTAISNSEIRAFREKLPTEILLVVDEAYGEFADGGEEPSFDLVERGDTIILRTFSKAYGLASGRIGWGLFPENVGGQVRKLIIPSSVSTVSAAMAKAAVEDQSYMHETCKMTDNLRDRFIARMRSSSLICRDSHTNFVLIEFPDTDQAKAADHALRQQGLVTRGMGGYGLSHCLRVTIAVEDVMMCAAEILEHWAKERLG